MTEFEKIDAALSSGFESKEFKGVPISKETHFYGWIPCLSGNLDFGLTSTPFRGYFNQDLSSTFSKIRHYFTSALKEHRNKLSESITINISAAGSESSHVRKIFLHSKVNWRDSLHIHPDRGWFDITVAAQVECSEDIDKRSLVGKILMYPYLITEQCSGIEQLVRLRDGIERNRSDLEFLKARLRKTKNEENADELAQLQKEYAFSLRAKIDQFRDHMSEVLGLHSLITVINFSIDPRGFVSFSMQPKDDNSFTNCRQAFYYLKYSVHKHKYHNSENDAILSIINVDKESCYHYPTVRLICQLKRAVSRILRDNDGEKSPLRVKEDMLLASGIVAYGKSLSQSAAISGYISSKIAGTHTTYFGNMKDAIDAQTQMAAVAESQRSSSNASKLTLVAVFTAIIIAVLSKTSDFKDLNLLPIFVPKAYSDGVIGLSIFFAFLVVFMMSFWSVVSVASSIRRGRHFKLGRGLFRNVSILIGASIITYLLYYSKTIVQFTV